MKKIILYATIAFSSGLFFTNLYNSIVNAANWERQVPQSITATRDFFVVANPGTFFKLVDPTNILLCSIALILFWKGTSTIRVYLGIALIGYITAMVLTFTYFYPRNEIMFMSHPLPDTQTLTRAAKEWGIMNWVRSCIWLVGLVCSFLALEQYTTNRLRRTSEGS